MSASAKTTKPSEGIGVGVLGLGTVGGGVLELLAGHAGRFEAHVGTPLTLRGVLVRDLKKSRKAACDPSLLTDEAERLLDDPQIGVIVEVMGGEEPAFEYITRALKSGKSVVTANKSLLAQHGATLFPLAIENGVDLAFEGAVGGGIPIVRTLREALVSDRVKSITGIINGTSGYVLTRMLDDGLALDAAVAEAQALGYAEADPVADIGGHDAAQKLAILAMLAFGARVTSDQIPVEGIMAIEPVDHRFADRFGFRIKHVVIGRDHGSEISLRVHPALVPERSVLANIRGVLNAVLIEGEALGPCLVSGEGAGGAPTAVSVVADLVDLARAIRVGAAGVQTGALQPIERPVRALGELISRYYVRFTVRDEPGVMARLAGSLGEAGVSIEQMVQDGQPKVAGGRATVVMLTHEAKEAALQSALEALAGESFMAVPARVLRIEEV